MGILHYEGVQFRSGKFQRGKDALTMEEGLRILVNGNPFTITMRTPGNDEALIRGLLFSEDIYREAGPHPELKVEVQNNLSVPTEISVQIPPEKIRKPYLNSRNLLSVSSCGICGKTELDSIADNHPSLEKGGALDPKLVAGMFDEMGRCQDLFSRSGGSHAAAAFTLEGTLLTVQEDIGRHNAVDKVIGQLLLQEEIAKAKVLTVSGRISYEIVSKCFMAGVPFLAAVSAPSSLAVDFAKELGITLLGFCRNGNFTLYSHENRIQGISHTEIPTH